MSEIIMGACTNCDAISRVVGDGTDMCPYCGIGTLIRGVAQHERKERQKVGTGEGAVASKTVRIPFQHKKK